MSIYGYLSCMDCKVVFWLGKAVFREEGTHSIVGHFHRGDASAPPNWARETLNRVLWNMLAEHRGHTLRVLLDHELEKLEGEEIYREIGGNGMSDMPLEAWSEDQR
jgi:hypothetical protein